LDFDFVIDDEGVTPSEPSAYAGGVEFSGRAASTGIALPDGGFINPRNGRAVRRRVLPFADGSTEVFVCFDGNPDGGPGTRYHGVNRGLVDTREEAEAWLRGKWPAGLVFLEGISERLSG
jgi:hypothetical protein